MNLTNPVRQKSKKKIFPVSTVCRNCGTQQISRYCHNCGQDLFSGSERSLKEITGNFMDTILAWDNKLVITLKYLVFYPGKLTNEFFAGKIASYVFPSKLFWFMSILFFASLSIDVEVSLNNSDIDEIITITQNNIQAGENAVTDKKKVTQEIRKIFDNRIKNNETSKAFITYAPYAMFLLIPVFALLVQMFYSRKCRYYASQMIFSLHFHTFVFLAFSLINVALFFYPPLEDSTALEWVCFLVPVTYFIVSLYVVYRPKKRHLLWKIPIIILLYAFAFLVVISLLAIVSGILIHGVGILKEIEMFD